MCFKKKFNADRHLNNVHSNVIDDAKKSVDVDEENYHSPSKYFKADAEHSDMALLETDDSTVCSPASKQPLTFNFHDEISAELIQQLSTSEKNTRKNETTLGETNMTTLVMKKLIVMMHRLPQQKMKKIYQIFTMIGYSTTVVKIIQASL